MKDARWGVFVIVVYHEVDFAAVVRIEGEAFNLPAKRFAILV
jgi:hypothetical protein